MPFQSSGVLLQSWLWAKWMQGSKTWIRAPLCKEPIYTIVPIAFRMIFSLGGHCSKRRAFASLEAPHTLLKLEAFWVKLFYFSSADVYYFARHTSPRDGLKHLYANSIRSPWNRNLQGLRLLLRLPLSLLRMECSSFAIRLVICLTSEVFTRLCAWPA